MKNIYIIGGSPCSGKSTIAEVLVKKYDLFYFKVDDCLEKYIKMGAEKGYEICRKQALISPEENWMRTPEIQCEEELRFYQETIGFALADMEQIKCNGMITEGAAYLPELMKKRSISKDRYISITPTKDFQVSHYKERPWIHYVLVGCSNQKKAFSNWMDRDALFAIEVQKQCKEYEYRSIINDGNIGIEEMTEVVSSHFGLSRK